MQHIKFYIDKTLPAIKFYKDKAISGIKFYIDTTPPTIKFYINAFATSVLVALQHKDSASVIINVVLRICTRLSDINPYTLADINNTTLNEISYKEVS